MCLRAQGIDNENIIVGRVRQARRLSDNNGCIGRGQGIDYASDGSDTKTEAERIWGRQWRLWRCDDGPEELATTTEVSEEEYDPEVLTTTTEVSDKEVEETTRPSERH